MKFYRYKTVRSETNVFIDLEIYNLHKETPKGYWIGYGSLLDGQLRSQSQWVSKTAKKRYAYPTRAEALHNYIKRCEHRLAILKSQIYDTEKVIKLIEKEKEINKQENNS